MKISINFNSFFRNIFDYRFLIYFYILLIEIYTLIYFYILVANSEKITQFFLKYPSDDIYYYKITLH